jgi:threonyl-tRNA synthetase
MRILSLHVDYIRFKPLKKALKNPEELSEDRKKEIEVKDALVILTAVEKGDTTDLVSELVNNIESIASQVKSNNIVLYPYAHLSSNLGNPETAQKILEQTEQLLKNKKYKTTRAPFGYYKEFELKCKGHPLAELSRVIKNNGLNENKEEDFDYKQALKSIGKSILDRSKLKDYDHRIIGQEMDLFSFSETAPGAVFWHNNGLIIYNELVNLWREIQQEKGYKEVSTPQILDNKLWKISGHWQKYKENIFLTDYEKRGFAVKPMNCPGGALIYKSHPRSYKELPLKMAELGIVHRQELSGVLAGLFRVIRFTQDDAHIFCTEEQLETQIKEIIDLVDYIYTKVFNLSYHAELSTRPEKYLGDVKDWNKAEKILENVLKKHKIKYKLNKGDGAFYGPKIDFHIKDSLDRTWQLATIQLDFQMPERFDLSYTDKDNAEHRPVMLHRVLYGSLERFIGILLEHTKGRLPTWLAPIQVRVINFTDRNNKYAEEVYKKLKKDIPNLRIDIDFRQTTVPAKVKEAEIQKIPFILVIGDNEEKSKSVAARIKGNSKIQSQKIEEFIKMLKKEIEEKK